MQSITFYGINAAGIKCKQKSFENVLNTIKPQIWTMQETKLRANEKIKCEALSNYQVYYLTRQESQGGGLAVGVAKEIESTLIREGDDNTELLSVQIMVGDMPIRVITGYGPQENANLNIKEKFWEYLEDEINQAQIDNHGLLVQIDGNLHAGPQLLKQDPNPQNKNGKIFINFLERNPNLTVVNTLDICEGLITRKRTVQERSSMEKHVESDHDINVDIKCQECEKLFPTRKGLNIHTTKVHETKEQVECFESDQTFKTEKDFSVHKTLEHGVKGSVECTECRKIIPTSSELAEHLIQHHEKTEEAVLDFLIVNEKLRPFLHKMIVDEDRMFSLCNLAQIRQNKRIIESDHNPLILDLKIQYSKKKPDRIEMFNLKNKSCQELFNTETENNQELLNIFSTEVSFEEQCKIWLKTFNSILYKCFKRVRIVSSKKQEDNSLKKELFERATLQKELKSGMFGGDIRNKIEKRISEIEEDIENEMGVENIKEIVRILRELGGNETSLGPNGRNKMWKILKEKYPTRASKDVPIGKKDKRGNVITNHEALKQLYLRTYIHRLRSRPIKHEFQELRVMKMELFDCRLEISKYKKSKPWLLKDLDKVINALKNDKARDPNGWVNELFKAGVAGQNLKLSMLNLFNKIKTENYIPDFMRKADVTTIYKGKGEKSDLKNDRGIFIVTVFRSILMKLIYNDKYEEIDDSMSDSQVGARKRKSIRNHVWIINGVIIDVLNKKTKEPVDLQVFDYKECFDSLWLEECLNDIYDGGLNDDKFPILYNTNSIVNVAVKTPVGKTTREPITRAIIQGDVFGPILCGKQVDTIGQECLVEDKYIYKYRNEVRIPPLGMVDDLLCVSACGFQTTQMNTYINYKTNSKKLQFGTTKCKKMHVGKTKEDFKCLPMSVDKWEEVEVSNENTAKILIEDHHIGQEEMEEKNEEKYLGDILSNDGRNIKNFKARVAKGTGIVRNIMTRLEGIPFGKYFFEVAIILRNSLLVSSVLCNCEAWYNITRAELEYLETVDVMLLRKILNAPRATPKEMLFLELGCMRLRDIIKQRRLLFLHYILNEPSESLVHSFLVAQMKTRNKKDWVTTVLIDLDELNIKLSFEEIKLMKKSSFQALVKTSINDYAFKNLEKLKLSHSKVEKVRHRTLQMRTYLSPNQIKATKEEKQLIFKLRCRVTDLKTNMKGIYENTECPLCKIEGCEDSQEHILQNCSILENITKEKSDKLNYKKLYENDSESLIEIARKFNTRMKIRETLINK